MSQLLAGHSRQLRLLAAALLLAAAGCRSTPPPGTRSEARRGGELVVSIRTEPRNFARFGPREGTTELVALLTQAGLVRINRVTDDIEPWLAESWTRSADGRQYTIKLRPNVTFSDGQPLTADDVVFSFAAAYEAGTADSLTIDGKRLTVAAIDPLTVTVTFAAPFGPGLRVLENIVLLPRHKLAPALKAGTLKAAWGPSTPPSELAGLGPFVLSDYQPGQRLVFTRNPHYWRKDEHGVALPYLDRVTLEVVPDQNTELLRLESGQIDATASEMPADAYAALKRGADAGTLHLYDLGPALYPDWLIVNLKPGAFAGDARAPWLQRDELRRAISLAVDRQLFADTVFLGAGLPVFGPVSPANKRWHWAETPRIPHDPGQARKLLASIGLADQRGDGILRDRAGVAARFTILTQKGRPSFERAVSVIRDELKKIGLTVDVAALEGNAVIQQIVSGKYDAAYFNFYLTDTDPSLSADFWKSSGSEHIWNPGQKTPATEWEAKIDGLMRQLASGSDEGERKRMFDKTQELFVAHQPMIYFVAPRIFAGSSTRLGNVAPAVWRPQLLWAPDTVTVTSK
jgi:peptide/nickel transport system substrate-binding protein